MKVSVHQQNKVARFEITGDIDEPGAAVLKSKFRELNRSSLTDVILDFKKVTHIGSAGIGKLLLLYKDLAPLDITLKIVNSSASVWELLRMVKLDTIFTISRG